MKLFYPIVIDDHVEYINIDSIQSVEAYKDKVIIHLPKTSYEIKDPKTMNSFLSFFHKSIIQRLTK